MKIRSRVQHDFAAGPAGDRQGESRGNRLHLTNRTIQALELLAY
jgi:hypothetical protein